jgi:hypothetical protein
MVTAVVAASGMESDLHVHLMRCDGQAVRLRKRDEERIGSREKDALCILPELLRLG